VHGEGYFSRFRPFFCSVVYRTFPPHSFHPDLRPPPLHVHDHRTLHARRSPWPSKPSWAQPLNALTSAHVRTTQVLFTITDTYHTNSCHPLVFAFDKLTPHHSSTPQKPSLS